MWRIVPQRALSEVIGWGASLGIPALACASVMLSRSPAIYGIDVSEAEKPLGRVQRASGVLHPQAPARRSGPSTARPGRVVSPADGTVVESGRVTAGQLTPGQGEPVQPGDLLADADAAARLEGGAYLVTYLSPRDYHRVHSPVAGG